MRMSRVCTQIPHMYSLCVTVNAWRLRYGHMAGTEKWVHAATTCQCVHAGTEQWVHAANTCQHAYAYTCCHVKAACTHCSVGKEPADLDLLHQAWLFKLAKPQVEQAVGAVTALSWS